MQTLGMDKVRADHSGHWFDADTLRFFGSRVGSTAYGSDDGRFRFFVSSERDNAAPVWTGSGYETAAAWNGARRYSVRVQTVADGSIGTVGAFGGYATRGAADRAAQDFAADPSRACSLRIVSELGPGGACEIHGTYHERTEKRGPFGGTYPAGWAPASDVPDAVRLPSDEE